MTEEPSFQRELARTQHSPERACGLVIWVILAACLALAPGRAGAEDRVIPRTSLAVGELSSVSVKVVGMSFVGRLYEKSAVFQRSGTGYKTNYFCLTWRGKHCACASAAKEINQSDMKKLFEFVSTLRDQGNAATCCDHPWTEIELTYSSGRRQKITVPFDLLRLEELFNPCGTPPVPFNAADSGSQLRLGKQLYAVGLSDRAVSAIEVAIRLDPQNIALEAYEILGSAYQGLRNYPKALEAYGHLLRARPNDAQVFLKLASLHSDFGRSEEAIGAYARVLQIEPTGRSAYEAYANLGHIYAAIGRLPEAVEAFKHALRIDSKADFTRYSLGKLLLALDDEKGALEQYDALKGLKSGHADDLHILAYQHAVRYRPDDPVAHFNLGNAYRFAGRHEDAIGPYRRAISLQPDLELAYSRLGYSYLELQRYEDAIEALRGAIRIDPQDFINQMNLGLAYSYSGRHEPGIEHLKEAIRLKPNSADAHNNLGFVLRSSGRNQEAIEPLDRAIRLNPDNELAHYNRGLAYLNLGQFADAVDALKQAVRLDPSASDFRFNLGQAYAGLKRPREAVAAFSEAIELRPNFAEARFHLGATYLSLGDRRAALKEYEELKVWDKSLARKLGSLLHGKRVP